jgi:hypothetical protein
VPRTILVPVIGVVFVDLIGEKLTKIPTRLVRPVLALIVTLVLVVGGSWLFDTKSALVARDITRQKLPPGVSGVLNYMTKQPAGNVVAATNVAAYYHTVPTSQQLFISRSIYYGLYCNKGGNIECADQLRLFLASNGEHSENISHLSPLIKKYKIDFFIINNKAQKGSFDKYQAVYKNQKYTVLRTAS